VTVEARDEDRPFSCVFVPVPELKAGKNRLHLDVAPQLADNRDAEVQAWNLDAPCLG
jgi:hypothetical protein